MSSEKPLDSEVGKASVERWLDRRRSVLLARGDFSALVDGYLDHSRRWDRAPDGLTTILMRQGLAAAALFLSGRPRDESVGWTLSLPNPAPNLFFTGDSARGTVTGRFFEDTTEDESGHRLYVQSTRPSTGSVQTHLDVSGLDVLGIFEQYHDRSLQCPARYFDYDDGRFIMVLSLPNADMEWLRELDREGAEAHVEAQQGPLDAREFVFMCGCTPERIVDVVRSFYHEDPEGFFEGHEEVEVQCPRCGRLWSVAEADL